jgi:Zn-finger in ubiquitin-hydrolases and other protein
MREEQRRRRSKDGKATEVVINPTISPSGSGCVECLATGGWWFHLRRCVTCGHIGCCNSSPSQHAQHHASDTGHPIVASFEPDEDWFFNYRTGQLLEAVPLAPPHHHPLDQPAPGPAGRVPPNWKDRLH